MSLRMYIKFGIVYYYLWKTSFWHSSQNKCTNRQTYLTSNNSYDITPSQTYKSIEIDLDRAFLIGFEARNVQGNLTRNATEKKSDSILTPNQFRSSFPNKFFRESNPDPPH